MTDSKISAMTAATDLVSATVPIVQGGANKKADISLFDARSGMVKLASGTVSSQATLDIVLTGYTAYRGIRIVLINCIPATNGVDLLMRVSTNGGSSYDSSSGNYMWSYYGTFITSASNSGSASDTSIKINNNIGNGTTDGVTASIDIWDQTNTAVYQKIIYDSLHHVSGGLQRTMGGGERLAAQDTDAVRFLFSSGNLSTGSYVVYGYN